MRAKSRALAMGWWAAMVLASPVPGPGGAAYGQGLDEGLEDEAWEEYEDEDEDEDGWGEMAGRAGVIPEAYPRGRYEAGWGRSPFERKTSPELLDLGRRRGLADELELVSLMRRGGKLSAQLRDTATGEMLRVTEEEGVGGMLIVGATLSRDPREQSVTLERGGERAEVGWREGGGLTGVGRVAEGRPIGGAARADRGARPADLEDEDDEVPITGVLAPEGGGGAVKVERRRVFVPVGQAVPKRAGRE
jgi:hypothetical protein